MSGGESVKDGVSVEKKFGEEEQTKASSSFLTLWVGVPKRSDMRQRAKATRPPNKRRTLVFYR